MDFYRKMLNHFHWTWLEGKFCHAVRAPRNKERMATKLARVYAKRNVRKEIKDET